MIRGSSRRTGIALEEIDREVHGHSDLPEDVISAVERHVKLGFDHIGLALSGDLPAFLDAAKREVLPYFRDEYKERRFNGEYRGRYGRDNLERLLDSKDLAHRIG